MSQKWKQDCLQWRGRELVGIGRHWCPYNDFLPVDDTMPEWPCGCFEEVRDMTDQTCECPVCGRLHRHLQAGVPPNSVLVRIDKFINAIAPIRLTKELDSIRNEVRAALGANYDVTRRA